ncbi:hypothetical protein ABT224_33400 [Streptomyces sp. NPDC001584]|uniref:hypothetical protein n=1 Tax=Streptomyces sp. NPDC001584 TaxID=3154521 RepID=UPI00331C45E3
MIPNGITPADDQIAADIFGVSVGYWRDKKHWTKIPSLKLLNRKGSRRRLYSKEQLLAARVEEERAEAVNEKPKYDLPPVPAGEHPCDLLDLEESLYALPEERRVALTSWKAYRWGTKTRLPDPDFVLGGKKGPDGESVGGEEFWRRQTILDWDVNRSGRGNPTGRPVGVKESQPRPVNQKAQERRDRTRQLIEERPGLTAAELAEDLGVHPVHAERLLSAARRESGTLPLTTQLAQERRHKTRELLDADLSGLTAPKLAEELGVHRVHAEGLLNTARQDKLRELLAKRPQMTVEEVKSTFGFSVTAHARTLLDKVRETK